MRLHSFLFSAMLCGALTAQVPHAFDFQAVARDASGNVLSAQALSVRLSVHSGTAGGAIAYQETHAVTTNAFGLFSVAVGQGSTVLGVFADVAWGAAQHFLHVELDASGGSNYVDMGTTQLLSVPYALHAGGVDCATVSLLGDTLKQANGCFVIIPGISAANGGCKDDDLDGYFDQPGCNTLVDCNDNANYINPGEQDYCGNGLDEDCSGTADDNTDPGMWIDWHPDADGDGYGSSSITVSACLAPPGHVFSGDDCDDSDASVFPGQNCSLFCSPAEAIWVDQNQAFLYEQADDLWLSCFSAPDPAACLADELAAGGQVPLGVNCLQCLADRYNCILANCVVACVQGEAACQACIAAAGCDGVFLLCMGIADGDGDGWANGSDCNDADATIHPLVAESCDAIDNDCDGLVDEGNVCCPDNDGDNFSICDGDCDDSNSQINPDATEVCDEQDNDCDGQIDEEGVCDCPPVGTPCDDGNACTVNDTEDGACNCISGPNAPFGTVCDDGDPNTSNDVCNGSGICIGSPCTDNDADGFTTCDGDCNDTNLAINPGAVEVCDGLDNDCDGNTDEGCAPELCDGVDNDGDGLTDAADPSLILVPCENQVGVCSGTQKTSDLCVGGTWLTCATSDYAIGSPAYEPTESSCDTQDNDCDGQVDEDNVCNPCTDNDADGFTTCQGDCNDNNANIRPGAIEVCNGVDDDCDGQVDEGGVCP